VSLIQAAARNNDVQMRMKQEVLTPGVKDSCESNLCPQAVPLAGKFEQGLSSGPE